MMCDTLRLEITRCNKRVIISRVSPLEKNEIKIEKLASKIHD